MTDLVARVREAATAYENATTQEADRAVVRLQRAALDLCAAYPVERALADRLAAALRDEMARQGLVQTAADGRGALAAYDAARK